MLEILDILEINKEDHKYLFDNQFDDKNDDFINLDKLKTY